MNFLSTIARKVLIPLLLLVFINNSAKSQTTLAPGDIAFTGYVGTSNAPANDVFSFVLLTNVQANTVIRFTDQAWGNDLVFNGSLGETTVSLTFAAAQNAGTEIIISGPPGGAATATLALGGSAGTCTGTTLSLSVNGDQVIAYQSAVANVAPFTFISAIHMNVYTIANGNPSTTDATNWDNLAAATQTANSSFKPAGLTTGTNAIWIGTSGNIASERNNARFNCALAIGGGANLNTAAGVRAACNNPAFWDAEFGATGSAPTWPPPSGCTFISAPPAPNFTLQPVNSTICADANTSFTIAANNAASLQWQVDNGGGFTNITDNATYSGSATTTLSITASTNAMNGYLYRCVATNGSGSTNSNSASLTVVPLPVNPTLLVKTPATSTVADGTPVSATFNPGSGGTGCIDDYRYTTNGGASYLPYTPGGNISTTGLAAATGVVTIEGRRASCTSLCQANYIALVTWIVTPLPAAATTLNAGDLAFSAYAEANSEFSFVLLRNIGPGTVVNFTNNGWYSNNTFRTGEETVTWTSNVAYAAGTEIKIAGLVATLASGGSAGTVTGTALGLSATGDQILAYRGTTASPTFITAIHMNVYVGPGDPVTTTPAAWDGAAFASPTANTNASALPTGLTTGVNAIWIGKQGVSASEFRNAAYGNCAGPGTLGSIATLRATLNNELNWIRNNNTPLPLFPIPTGCPYLGVGNPPNITGQPANSAICELANTSFTIVAAGATSYQWQVDPGTGFVNITNNITYSGATTATLTINAAGLNLNGYLYRAIATNGSGSSISNNATLTVTAIPVAPTLLTRTPVANNVVDGTPVSATFSPGAGGTGCTDDFRYTTDGGLTYLPYTPGSNISTTGIAAGSGWVFIEGRRANCSAGCQGVYKVLALWYITPLPVAATTLNAGDVAFSSYAATTDEFSFVLIRNIGPGTVINFTNNGWYSNNTFRTGEETVTWTAPAGGLTAGTEIKIAGLTATRSGAGAAGTVTGTPLTLSITGDQILAYRGTTASPTFITAIHMNVYTLANSDPTSTTAAAWDGVAYASPAVNTNASALPTGLTTGVNAIWIGTQDILGSEFVNAAYGNCAGPGVLGPLTGLRAALNNQANWVRNNNPVPGFSIPTGCNYLSVLCPAISVTNPVNLNGAIGVPFSETFTSAGGAPVVTYSTSSTLPNGLTLSATGVLSGTPTQSGTFPIVVTATDGNGCTGTGAAYNLFISACTATDQTVTALPTNVCSGGSSTITVGASQPGVNYTLRIDPANTVVAGPTASNGPAINFSTGAIASTTTYNVLAETDKYSINLNGGQAGPAIPQNAALDVTNNFTIEGWIKPAGNGAFARLYNKDGSHALGISNNQNDLTFTRHTSGDFSRPFTFVNGTWYHIACTYVGGTVELFVNGNSIGTVGGVPPIAVTTFGGHIGSDAGGGFNQFNGNIDNVRIWNSVRTQPQIAANQTAFLTSTGNPTLVASWWIIEGSGNVRDYSANAINSTSLNAVWQVDAPVAPCSIVLTNKPTVTVDPANTITLTSAPGTNAQTVCINTAITNITYNTTGATGATFSGLPAGVTGAWAANVVTISGAPTTTVGSPFNYTVTLTGGCGTVTATGTITVNAVNTITLTSAPATTSQTVCINSPITNITYSTTGATGATFSGLPAGVTGAWAANVVTISGSPTTTVGSPFGYTVTLTGGCGSITATGTITVTPANTITLSSAPGTDAQSVCINTPITNITYTTTGATGATFSGLPAGVTGSWAANVVTISGTPTTTVGSPFNYTVTLTGGCGVITANGTITVNPIPNAVATPSSQSLCSGLAISPIIFSGAVGGTTYNWVRDNVGTVTGSIGANGSGNITGTLINNTASPITVTFTITPTASGCTGAPITATVTVNPLSTATITGGALTVCQGADPVLSATADPNYSYVWGRSLFNAPYTTIGTGQTQVVTASGNYLLTVTNQYGCVDTAQTVMNVADYVFNGTIAAGDATQTGRINRFAVISTCAAPKACPGIFTATGNRLYDSYTITNVRNVPVCATIGINSFCATNIFCVAYTGSFNPASPCTNYLADGGSSFTFSGFYEATIPANGTIVVVVHEVNTGAGCAGYQLTVDVPRDPSAITATPGTTSCSGLPITLTAPVANTYSWSPGGATTQSIVHNTGTTNYTVTLGYGNVGCNATASQSVTIANPVVNAVPNQAFCNGASATVSFSGTGASTYNWTNSNTAIGLGASGSGNLNFVATNATAAPISGTITVTPVNGVCTGTPITFTITVANQPNITSVTGATICGPGVANLSATSNGIINWWDTPTGGIVLNTGNTFSPNVTTTTTYYVDAAINSGLQSLLAMPGQSGTFPGNVRGYWFTAPTDFVITSVNVPTTASTAGQSIAVVKFNGNTPPPVFSATTNAFTTEFLTRDNVAAGSIPCNIPVLAGEVIGLLGYRGTINSYAPGDYNTTIAGFPVQLQRLGMQFPLTTSNPQNIWREFGAGTSISRIEFEYSLGQNCISAPRVPVTATVKALPVVTATPATQTTCSGSAITTIVLSSTEAGTTYAWTRDNTGTATGIAASGSGDISGSLTNTTNAPVTVTFTITSDFNGCPGLPVTATVVVNPTATINPVANQVVCNGDPTAAINFSSPTTGGTIVYNWTNNTTSIGLAAAGAGDIAAFTATNITNAPVTATITVTPSYTNAGTTCIGTPITFTITVNPTPNAVATPASQTICTGSAITTIVLTGNVAGAVYNWTRDNAATVTGIAAAGSGNIAGSLTNTTNAAVTVTFTITPSYTNGGTTCTGTPITATVIVNPIPNAVATPAAQTICSGAALTTIVLSGNVAGTVYNWTRDNTVSATGIAATGSGNIAGSLTNTTNAPVTVTFTITPSYTNGGTTCTGTPITATVTVQPVPQVNQPVDQVVCNNTSFLPTNFTTTVTGATVTYNWLNNNTSVGLGASGTGNIPAFIGTNATNAPNVATVTVTPVITIAGGGAVTQTFNYTGAIQTFTVPAGVTSVNVDAAGAQGGSVTVTCAATGGRGARMVGDFAVTPGEVISILVGQQGLTNGADGGGGGGSFVVRAGNIPLLVAGGGGGATNNIGQCGANRNGIDASTTTSGTASANGAIAGGTAGNGGGASGGSGGGGGGFLTDGTAGTGLPGNNGKSYLNGGAGGNGNNNDFGGYGGGGAGWFTGGNGGGGGGYSGGGTSGSQPFSGGGGGGSFNAGTNQVNTAGVQTGNGIVTITYSGSATCTGTPVTFTYTVNPTAVIDAVADRILCNGATSAPVNFTSPTTGGTIVYDWTNDQPGIGLAASSTGNIPGFTAINITNAPIVATIVVTPTYTNGGVSCVGTPITFTITVNPTATVNMVANQVVCNGAATTAINFTSPTTGGTIIYNWTNNTTSIGLAASGTGNIASFTATNITNAPVTATVTVTPSYTNGGTTCVGTPVTFTITVNPTATVNAIANQVACNGAPANAVVFSGNTSGTICATVNEGGSLTLAAPPGTVITAILFASYGTPNGTCGSFTIGGCHAANSMGIVSALAVGQTSVSIPATNTTFGDPCGGTPKRLYVEALYTSSNTTYNWTNNTTSIGLAATGTGNIASFTATNITNAPVTATITVTPSYTNGGTTCIGTPTTFTITVNPTVTVNAVADQVVCDGAPTTAVNFTSTTTGGTIVYNWTNNTTSIGLAASGTGNIASFTATNITNAPVTATITVTPSYTNGGTTCIGTPITFTITVNPTAIVNPVANQLLCNGATTAAVAFSSPTTGGTIVYNWTNNAPSIGLAATGTGNIASFTATNITNAPVIATITVTASYTNGGITCTGTPVTFTYTVNPTAVIDAVADRILCNGATSAPVNFTSPTTGGTIVYDWTNDQPGIGLAASGTGNIPGFTAINITNAPIVATIVVTPTYTNGGVSCVGTPITFTITVNPPPIVDPVASQTVCANASTAPIVFTTPTTGGTAVYNWTNDNTTIGLGASGTGNIPSFTGLNPTNGPNVANLTVTMTYTSGGISCVSLPVSFTITINPTPIVNPVASQVVCNGSPTATVNFTSPTTGPTGALQFNWVNDNATIGLALSGTGSIPSFTAINPGVTPAVATIIVTPVYTNGGVSCTGASITFTITVNPTPTVAQPASQVLCNGSPTAPVVFTGTVAGTVFNWTNTNTTIGLAASGTGDIASFTATNTTTVVQTATITVTPTYTNGGVSCSGTPVTFTITVNPTPSVNPVANQTVCSGTTVTASFTGPVAGTVYNWTNSNTAIGLAASGTGNISFVSTNITNAPITGTVTVTPTFTNGGVTCTGTPISFTITVNPIPSVNAVANQTVCNGSPTAAVTFAGPVAGTVYNWTNNTTSIGLAASGTGNIASFTATNITNAPVTATITVTPVFTNGGATCTGASRTFTITVNPTPTVNTVANQIVCNGAPTTAVTFTGSVAGTVYSWTNSNTTIGLAPAGTGNIAAFTAINTGTTAVTATITVTPTYTNGGVSCTGASTSFTITVNPTPTVNAVASQVLCNGATTTAVSFTGAVAGTVYNWTNSNATIGLAATGTGNIAAFTATNTTGTVQVATITVTPSAAGCAGASTSFTITVNPTPTVNQPANQTVCNGATTAPVVFTGATAGTVYSWTNNNTGIGLNASGTGNIAAFTAVNNSGTVQTATITVTPAFSNGGVTCTGAPVSFTITVNPLPNTIFSNIPPRVCLTDTLVNLANKVSPAGGTWAGPGVSGNTFSATSAGVGVKTLSYTVTNSNGCTATTYVNVTVNDCIDRHNVFATAIRIYPNPSSGLFNIRFLSDIYTAFNVNVVTADGKVLKAYRFNNLRYGSVIPMDLRILPGGTYFLQIYNETERAHFPFVIVR